MNNLFLILLLISLALLITGIIKPQTSLFWYNKKRTRKKSLLIYSLSILLFFVLFGITIDKNRVQSNDPLNIGRDSIKALIGKKVPYDKWGKWGNPETLEGTNNQYWAVYLDSANISFVSDKLSDKILYADFDKKKTLKHLEGLKEIIQTRRKHINDLLYNSGMKSVNIKLMQLIQADLNDPNSMENIDLNFEDRDSLILVRKTFSAKNKFGGRIKNEVIVSIDTLGNINKVLKWIN